MIIRRSIRPTAEQIVRAAKSERRELQMRRVTFQDLEAAARRGHSRAMNLLGRCWEEGWGCAKSAEDAFYWYRESARAGCFRGQLNYAACLRDRGLDREAAEWFVKAAAGVAV
jgi:TPR repeat protein